MVPARNDLNKPGWMHRGGERKFDGERCLAFRDGDQLRLMTRGRQQVTGTYPEIAGALAAQDAAITLTFMQVFTMRS
jgi:ATP-dependent DNA ligase